MTHLSQEKTEELVKRYQDTGDLDARNAVIDGNIGLVGLIVGRMALKDDERYNDYFQEGVIGMVTAIDKYDPSKARFSTYAVQWIRQAIQRCWQNSGTIRIPVHMHEKMAVLAAAEEQWPAGTPPTDAELAEATGLSLDQVAYARYAQQASSLGSLDLPMNDDGDTVAETVPSGTDGYATAEANIAARELLAVLRPGDRAILARSAGIGCAEETLDEIAKSMGTSKQNLHLALRRCRERLKHAVTSPEPSCSRCEMPLSWTSEGDDRCLVSGTTKTAYPIRFFCPRCWPYKKSPQ